MTRKRRRAGKAEKHGMPSQKRVCLDTPHRRLNVKSSELKPKAVQHPVLPTLTSGASPLARLVAVDCADDSDLSTLLYTSLVGIPDGLSPSYDAAQRIEDATQCTAATCTPSISQPEIVDLALQTLFYRSHKDTKRYNAVYPGKPNSVLTSGYRNLKPVALHSGAIGVRIENIYPNSQVTTLKSPTWAKLLGIIKEDAMLDLLLNTSVFIHLGGQKDKGNYYQLTGPPISDFLNNPKEKIPGTPLKLALSEEAAVKQGDSGKKELDVKTHNEIVFVRSRMFYSKPSYSSRGNVQFGLKHIHILNRYSNHRDKKHTSHVLKYIFPRQFGLHNAFTSTVDRRETVQPFQDYTLREQEIAALEDNKYNGNPIPIPKRLKGMIMNMVAKLQQLQKGCSYYALIKHYCPVFPFDAGGPRRQATLPNIGFGVNSSPLATQIEHLYSSTISTASTSTAQAEAAMLRPKETFMDMASPAGDVSGFIRAVISCVIPKDFWGNGDVNRKVLLRTADRFVKLRRYESLSLHDTMQGLRLRDFDWLCPPKVSPDESMSKSDEIKRRQLLAEFIYWIFDSFLIPLLRAHFYITESNVDRNRIFYFRHDVWKRLSEPTLNELKTNMFQEMKMDEAKGVLSDRDLGYTQLRLLPKEQGVRPIMNLKRRETKIINGKSRLTSSINTIMKPVFDVLAFEKNRNPARLGSSMFSVGEMYTRLKDYKSLLLAKGWQGRKLYFAKVDVVACFDTIPQKRLLQLIQDVVLEEEYRLEKYAEVRGPPPHQAPNPKWPIRAAKRFLARAKPADEFETFEDFAKRASESAKSGVVFVDDVAFAYKERHKLLNLLNEHVKQNIIKIGKKYFRQKTGIPQGSVLSSILCNFFYADFEREKLPFTSSKDGLLLRLIDDFLFITTNKNHAEMFIQAMHVGSPKYGVQTKHEKTLVNFETSVDGKRIDRLLGSVEFPYCGNLVNTKTLDVQKDRERKVSTNVNDMITVEYSRQPGSALFRKTVHSFKIQAHPMYFDTTFNSKDTLVKNVYHSFVEAAMKFHRYTKSLNRANRMRQDQLISVVSQVLELAFVMLKSRQKANENYKCAITHAQVKWLGAHAFKKILTKKQTSYQGLLKWLCETEKSEGRELRRAGLSGLDLGCFEGFRY